MSVSQFALPPFAQHIDRKVAIWIAVVTSIISVVPFFAGVLGVDLGTQGPSPDFVSLASQPAQVITDSLFYALSGSFTHTLLEWSAFCIALFIFFLSFVHFRLHGDSVTLIIGFALFTAGCMDAFHTLAADRLIDAVAPNTDLIPFTWAISRVFVSTILVFGSLLVLSFSSDKSKLDVRVVMLFSLALGVIAYAIIHFCAVSESLPQTMYPDSIIKRPWDVVPLLIFIFGGIYVFPRFYARHTNVFTFSLLLSAIPSVATGLHMSFGSTALFDHHFNAAHFLKIIAYLVPLIGLSLDYVRTYRETQQAKELAEKAHIELDIRAKELLEHATIDGLTNLYNRRYFDSQLNRELAVADRTGMPLSLCILDVDHFKKTNDEFGHLAGDHVLKEIAVYLKGRLRKSDTVSRFGGEEFVLLLPATALSTAEGLCNDIRESIEKKAFKYDSQLIKITISIGLCSTLEIEGFKQKDLIQKADESLYMAKGAGRNQVVSAIPLMFTE